MMNDLVTKNDVIEVILGTSLNYNLLYGKKEPKEGFVRSLIHGIDKIHNRVIFCKDCKHRPAKPEHHKNGFDLDFPDYKCPCMCSDDYYSWYPDDDWYCANGEKKDDKA